MKLILCFLVAIGCSSPLFAQGTNRQVKFVTHTTVPAEPGWYPAGWSITNVRQDSSDNLNFMAGVGRKTKTGWVELMLQRQYAIHTSDWLVDFRLSQRLSKRAVMFVEVSPFLEKLAVYQFARVEYRVGPVNLMVESENILRRTEPDSLGLGPGLSLPPKKLFRRLKFAPALAWQWRPRDTDAKKPGDQDPNFLRFYLAFPF